MATSSPFYALTQMYQKSAGSLSLSCRPSSSSGSRSDLPPSSHPFISLSGVHTHTCIRSSIFRVEFRKQALGVFLLTMGRTRDHLKARLIVSLFFARIAPSFNKSLLRLVGDEYHSMPHCTTQGTSMSQFEASNFLFFLAVPRKIQRSSRGLLGCKHKPN